MTLLVMPHDEHNVRQYRVSYARLRLAAVGVGILLLLFLVAIFSYTRVASRAARSIALERENARLEAENAKVVEIAENLARTEQAYDRIRAMAGLEGPTLATATRSDGDPDVGPDAPRGWPLTKRGFVSAGFSGPEEHSGVDIAVPTETPVLATAPGRVSESGVDDVLGEYVVIRHAGGYETLYAHNASRLIAAGADVERGQTIAYSGSTGRSSAPHLHYEVRRDGTAVDPSPFMR